MKFHLLSVLKTLAFPLAIVDFKFGYVRIARVKDLIDHLQRGYPPWSR